MKKTTQTLVKTRYILSIAVFAMIMLASTTLTAQVAVNTDGSSADGSAMLDVKSTNKGFLPPRMTTSERNAIASPVNGLTIYNITTGCMNFYLDGSWKEICAGTGTPIASYTIGAGGSCANTTVNGTYTEMVALDSNNTVTLDATVTSTGPWSITTNTVNGYSFSGSGTFASTGTVQVTLNGTGTPTIIQSDNFTAVANGSGGTCSFTVVVASSVSSVYNPTTGKYWMDRNLGASQVATSSTDAAAYGDLYQWGRGTDGHQIRTSGTTTTLATTSAANGGNAWDGLFVANSSSADWLTSTNNTLWQGVNGTNNPCPSGYRLPTQAEWTSERLTWGTFNAAGAYNSLLKLPKAGNRLYTNGTIVNVGSYGFYWSSTVSGSTVYFLGFYSYSGYQSYTTTRSYGYSVRCIQD